MSINTCSMLAHRCILMMKMVCVLSNLNYLHVVFTTGTRVPGTVGKQGIKYFRMAKRTYTHFV